MFGMSFGEIFVIALIAILFLGPEKLPDAMVKIAKFFKSFKKSINAAKDSLEQEMHLSELKDEAISYKKKLENTVDKMNDNTNIFDDITGSISELKDSLSDDDEKLIDDAKPKRKKPQKKKIKKKLVKKDEDSQDV
jgi:sec-independent protein translocase protein TatB